MVYCIRSQRNINIDFKIKARKLQCRGQQRIEATKQVILEYVLSFMLQASGNCTSANLLRIFNYKSLTTKTLHSNIFSPEKLFNFDMTQNIRFCAICAVYHAKSKSNTVRVFIVTCSDVILFIKPSKVQYTVSTV